MAHIERSVLVPYSADQMYALVEAVEDYPRFLPWCGGTEVEFRDEHRTRAAVVISFRGVKQRFSTDNAKHPPERIEMRLIDGPFKHLDGLWTFTALGSNACKVHFRLHYEFSSRLLEKLVGPVFDYIAGSFVDAFSHRADKVYQKP